MSVDFSAIKSSVSIVDVCGEYVVYTKQDHEKMWGLCPFHDEKTASFTVSFSGRYAGRFHCFGCDASGDVIDFVERVEHCTKPEAALKICERFAPHLLTEDGGKFKRQINKAKKSAAEEKTALSNAAREVCGVIHQQNEEQADNIRKALDDDVYTSEELYTLLRTHGANSTAETIEHKFHPEEFDDAPKRGRPTKEKLCLPLLEEWLNDNGITIRRNVITKSLVTTGLEDVGLSSDLLEEFTPVYLHDRLKFEFSCTLDCVQNLLGLVAARNEFNPVLDLLARSPAWDGTDRLKDVFSALHIPENDVLSRSLLKKWFIQSISLLFNNRDEPFGSEGVLVLNGMQGTGKTSFLRKMFLHDTKDGYLKTVFRDGIGTFKEGMILDKDKDAIAQTTNAWGTELGELAATLKSPNEDFLKNFVTRFFDEYRMPYGRTSVSYPRRTSLAGTVNDPEFLGDPTGSRRWWVIPITQRIDLDALDTLDKIQFWKQIEFYSNENRQAFRLTQDEMTALNVSNQIYEKKLLAQDDLEDIFAKAVANPSDYKWIRATTSDLALHYERLSRYSDAVLGRALNKVLPKYSADTKAESTLDDKERSQIERARSTERGRFRLLPFPRSHIIYSSPSEVPLEDKPSFAANVAQEVFGK